MDRLIENPDKKRADLMRIPRLLYNQRRRIFIFTVAVMVLAAVINFIIPNHYRSAGSILPSGSQPASGALGSLASAVSGIDLMTTEEDPSSSSQLFPDILKSEAIRTRVLQTSLPPDIADEMEAKSIGAVLDDDPIVALKELDAATAIHKDKITGIVYVSFEWTNAKFAQFVAAEYIRQLDSFCSNERFARLDENRIFVMGRVKEAEARLKEAEDSLLQYREQNRNYQMASSPELEMEHQRRVRKVAEISEVYALLQQQLEMATIEAKRKKPVVALLDYPTVPQEKSRPHRLTNIAQITIAAFLLTCAFIVLSSYLKEYMSPEELQQLATVRNRVTFRRRIQV